MRLSACLTIGLTALSLGCGTHPGTGNDAGPGDAGSVTAAQACADHANAICALRGSCSNNYLLNLNYGSEAICVSRVTANCLSNLAAPENANTPARVESCAGQLSSFSCTQLLENNLPSDCLPVAGPAPTSSPCYDSSQCATAWCGVSEIEACGNCNPMPVVTASSEISSPIICVRDADCGRGTACPIPNGQTSGVCAVWVAPGGSCLTGTYPCQPGYSCVGDNVSNSTNGTCQLSGATVGAACDSKRQTNPACYQDMGLVCIPTASGSTVGTCQNYTLVAANAACGDVGSNPITGVAMCEAGGLCAKASPSDNTGTCVATAADGAACDSNPANGPPCLTPATCVPTSGGTAGICTLSGTSVCTAP